jgi:allantoicase
MTEPLTTGQSVVMKYRTDTDLDDATAWTTILTHNTVGQTTHYALNIESTGGDLPNYNEIQFRLESYGGAVITGFEYGGEVIDNGLM